MNTYKNMWIKSIGILLLLSVMLILSQPVMADVVNINKADAAAFEANLEGIGPVKAEAIVKYRKKHGSFKSVNDLKNVPGIGKETMLKNKNNLSTSRGLVKAAESKLKNSDKTKVKKAKDKVELKRKKSLKKSGKTKEKLKTDKKLTKNKSTEKTKLNKKSLKSKSDKKLKEEKLKKAKAKKKLKEKIKKSKKD